MSERTHVMETQEKGRYEDMQGRIMRTGQFLGFDEPGGLAMVKFRPNSPVQGVDIGGAEMTYGQREELAAQLVYRDDLAFDVRPSTSGPNGPGVWELDGSGDAKRIMPPAPRQEDDHGDGVSHNAQYIPKYEQRGQGQRAEEEQPEESQEHGPAMGM